MVFIQTKQSRDPAKHMIKHVDIFDCYNVTRLWFADGALDVALNGTVCKHNTSFEAGYRWTRCAQCASRSRFAQ